MARLIISSPDGKNGILELNKPLITVGRGNANDLVLNDASVSRFHAVFKLRDNSIFVADRGSTNGIVLNDEKISKETELKNGDVALLGLYRLRLENVDDNGLQVRRGEWPSTLNNLMRDRAQQAALPRSSDTHSNELTDLAGRVKKLERENYLLTVLYEAGKALSSKLDLEHICEQVISLACLIEGVERGFVMLFDERGEVAKQTEVRYRDPESASSRPQIILSTRVLELIRKERQPILIDDVSADERFSGSESLKISGLRSAMCAPLVGKNQLFGVLYVDNLEKASALVVANPDIRLGGVNQEVTVMFADIRGFTTMSETMEPSRVVEILNEYFTRVTDVIFDNGGTLDKYIGDAVMAVFGAPISKGNDAAAAVNSAMHIQRLLVELNRDAAAREWPELRVGIGINTGHAIAGNIGSPRRLDYTVVGDAVNTAQRLMTNAAGGQILISESTARKLGKTGKTIDLERLPELKVKGRSEAVPVFRVNWVEQSAETVVLPKKKRPARSAPKSRKVFT